jgi:hypothetical protein
MNTFLLLTGIGGLGALTGFLLGAAKTSVLGQVLALVVALVTTVLALQASSNGSLLFAGTSDTAAASKKLGDAADAVSKWSGPTAGVANPTPDRASLDSLAAAVSDAKAELERARERADRLRGMYGGALLLLSLGVICGTFFGSRARFTTRWVRRNRVTLPAPAVAGKADPEMIALLLLLKERILGQGYDEHFANEVIESVSAASAETLKAAIADLGVGPQQIPGVVEVVGAGKVL